MRFIWYDYETYGLYPQKDQIAQVAMLTTDENLNPIEPAVSYYVKPKPDYLPSIDACLFHKIDLQSTAPNALTELELSVRMQHHFLKHPNTCIVGYNSLRFDDEFTRFLFFRNLADPYTWHWENQNSRWDIIDLVRMVYVYQNHALCWPKNDTGEPIFKLEKITAHNHIEHTQAHDALSDVKATAALAKKIKTCTPKMYNYYLALRSKHKCQQFFADHQNQPFLYTSGRISAKHACTSIFWHLCRHPDRPNEIIVYDLRFDPSETLNSLASEKTTNLVNKMYASNEELAESGQTRLPFKTIKFNRCPAIVPIKKLDPAVEERIGLSEKTARQHLKKLAPITKHIKKIQQLHQHTILTPPPIEESLYSRGFNCRHDNNIIKSRVHMTPTELIQHTPHFEDPNLQVIYLQQCGRFGGTLNHTQEQQWAQYLKEKAMGQTHQVDVRQYQQQITEKLNTCTEPKEAKILKFLIDHSQYLARHAV